MRVLVTGASGFAGRHVVDTLLQQTNWDIVTLHRSYSNQDYLRNKRVQAVFHDLHDPLKTQDLDDVEAVVNLASSSDVLSFMASPTWHAMNNIKSTLNMLEWARGRDLRAFIQVSTNEVYGPVPIGHLSREWDPPVPSTPYSASKAAQEMLAIGWHQTYGIPVIIVNTIHLFGEGQPEQRFVARAIKNIMAGKKVQVYTARVGNHNFAPVRNWTYVGDFARAIYEILLQDDKRERRPQRWNVAGPVLSCSELAQQIARILDLDLKIEWVTDHKRPGYDHRYVLDTNAFDRISKTFYGLIAGLERTITWMKREAE